MFKRSHVVARLFTKLNLPVVSKKHVKKMWERLVAAKLNNAAESGSRRNLSNVNLAYPDNRFKFFTESTPAFDNTSIRENTRANFNSYGY